jgi:hypothetical protein
MTSPPLIVESCWKTPIGEPGANVKMPRVSVTTLGKPVRGLNHQVLIVSLRKRSEPSAKVKLAPAGWKLDGAAIQESLYYSGTFGTFRKGMIG